MKTKIIFELEEKVKKTFNIKCLKNDNNMTVFLRKCVEAYIRDSEAFIKFLNQDK